MSQLSVVEEGAVGAPAEQVYRYIADMRNITSTSCRRHSVKSGSKKAGMGRG